MGNMDFNILGQTPPPVPPPIGIHPKLAAGELPGTADYVFDLTALHEVWALLLIAVGVVYLLNGWKTFKVLVIVNAAFLGAALGSALGNLLDGGNLQLLGGVAGAVLVGVLAWPLIKGAVSVMGALTGAMVGYGLWSYAGELAQNPTLIQHSWAGALLGMVTLGLLGMVAFKGIVMVFTAFQGGIMVISGLLAVLLKPYALQQRLHEPLVNNPHVLPLVIGVPALLGLSLQYIASAKKASKKKKAISSA